MGILAGIAFGLVAGALAKFAVPGPDPAGTVGSMLLGGAGGLIGSALGSMLVGASWTAVDGRSLMLGVIGSLIVLLGYRTFAFRAAA